MIEVDSEDIFYRYKYLPFGQDKLSLNVINEGTIKFTCPLDFNDPFDCQPIAYIDKKVTKRDSFKLAESSFQHLSPAKRYQERNKMYARLKNSVKSGRLYDSVLRSIGVLSLSRVCNDILMWSHYAENHKGFVVGFEHKDFDKLNFEGESPCMLPQKVLYNSNRPIFDFSKSSEIINCLLVKSPQWEYEQEERAFTSIQGPGIHKYDRQKLLHCVIAGAKIEPVNLSLLKDAVKKASDELGREIKFKQAKLSNKSFEIEIHNVKL
ncbi:DUF2971 domain-containing protein [Aeromonas hydrophila]|uniref:DUF2971 domain-containing protein n=1 Tax=Aeromonas hydrophila TaxID=644 RepID=UPI002B4945FD|nr:DUF2971 domain-containing protein [Aeromonas hydrophila]